MGLASWSLLAGLNPIGVRLDSLHPATLLRSSRGSSKWIRNLRRSVDSFSRGSSLKWMGRSFVAVIISIVPAMVAGSPGQQGTEPPGTRPEVEFRSGEILDFASAVRATPITEPGIPATNWASTKIGNRVKAPRDESLLQIGDDALVLTEKLDPQFKFYVQSILCTHGPGKVKVKVRTDSLLVESTAQGAVKETASLWDATLLGTQERAATFYEANSTFRVAGDPVSFPACMPVGMTFSQPTRGSQVMLSHDRVLAHMCNWLRFLVQIGDSKRSTDFLTTILAKHKQVLLEEDSAKDLEHLAADVDLFDRWFPFEEFDGSLEISTEQRAQVRDFLRTTISLRRKLQQIEPAFGDNIARDEALERRMR